METLKKYFPFSFKEKSEIGGLIVNILLYLAGAIVAGFVIGLFAGIPVVNWIFGLLGALAELYVAAGILLSVLDYLKKMK